MKTTIRRAYQSYQSAEKALRTAERRVRMIADMFTQRFTLAYPPALVAAHDQHAVAYQEWLDAGMLVAAVSR